MTKTLQGQSYKVCSTTLPIFLALGLFIPVGISAIIYYQHIATLRGHLRLVCNIMLMQYREGKEFLIFIFTRIYLLNVITFEF